MLRSFGVVCTVFEAYGTGNELRSCRYMNGIDAFRKILNADGPRGLYRGVVVMRPDSTTVMAVQGVSAAMAGGVSALVKMSLDTIQTRLQVLDNNDDNNNNGNRREGPMVGQDCEEFTLCFRVSFNKGRERN
ncbi:putative mitochondrial carrier domain superfamily [Helianthus debilis subsp. tardiflorus]